jgi:hypothetical protein
MAEESLTTKTPKRPMLGQRNASQLSGFNVNFDPERVIWQGDLMYLQTGKGIPQWKKRWVVVRPKSLSIYKDNSEYSPTLILSMDAVKGAVDIDPLSKSKEYCLQIITESKSYRFCAYSEDSLNKCLGAFKRVLVKRGR